MQKDYPDKLRRIRFKDSETNKTYIFITNNMTLPALTICALYKSRWQFELFFKWIKQHLRIKSFTAPQKMLLSHKYGLPFPFMCW